VSSSARADTDIPFTHRKGLCIIYDLKIILYVARRMRSTSFPKGLNLQSDDSLADDAWPERIVWLVMGWVGDNPSIGFEDLQSTGFTEEFLFHARQLRA